MPTTVFTVEPFGGEKIQVGRQDLAHVIEARTEEIFQHDPARTSSNRATTACCRRASS
jgi:cell division ATPase FtsA